MATAIDNTTKHPDELADMIADSIGCTGSCTYTNLILSSGQCTGGGSCHPCPPVYSPSIVRLAIKMPKLIANPYALTLPCGLDTMNVPLLTLFDEYVRTHGVADNHKKRSNFYRNLSVLLGVVSLLLLLGLLYAVLVR